MMPLRVLIVEDSADDAMLLVRELRRGDYDVTFELVDSAAAMNAALDKRGWDLVICDYSMPHFSGSDALRLLRSKGSDLPFIFLSGTIGEDTAVAALKQGAQDYLMKDNLKRLLPAVQRELEETQRRQERSRLEQQVQQLEKSESIGRLAGGIAHDFNNALGVILGWTDFCCEEAPAGSPLRDGLQKIHNQAQFAAGLTSQLLAFARRQVLQPRSIRLNAVIAESTGLLKSVLGEQIEVDIKLAQDLAISQADPTQIGQVIMNLCLNARDAMPKGGRLAIETHNVAIGEEFRKIHPYVPAGRFVQLSVSDTGIGMDAATKSRIFEPFFTTKELGRGTGLGLATVYGIVKQHGGFLTVDSKPGLGTTFDVYLPASSTVPEISAAAAVEISLRGTETVLVADDHEGIRELGQRTLSLHGYKVIPACNGQEAVRLFKQKSEEIQLVLLDVVMPGLSGPDAYTQMSAIKPDLPVIFASGYTALADPQIRKGAAFLQKPYTMETLNRTVRSVLDQHRLNFMSAVSGFNRSQMFSDSSKNFS